jgi:CheY-like chemotaxis protein
MSKGTILLVEDDDIIAKVVGWRLEKLGYSLCGRASSGTEALNLLERNVPDLILMDINIKGEINGIETTKMIKKRIHIPVIYLTSHSDDVTLARAKETYPEGFISKPFNDNDLKVAIELALNSSTLR